MADPISIEPTAQAIEAVAAQLKAQALELREFAKRARNTGDFVYSACAVARLNQLRADLSQAVVTRPLREYGFPR